MSTTPNETAHIISEEELRSLADSSLCYLSDSSLRYIICRFEEELARRRRGGRSETPPLMERFLQSTPDSPPGRQYMKLTPSRLQTIEPLNIESPTVSSPSLPPKIYTRLPDDWDYGLPLPKDAIEILNDYEPTKCSEREVKRQIDIFLAIIDHAHTSDCKAIIIQHFFRLLTVNRPFVKKNSKFHRVIVDYLCKFESDPYDKIRDIAKEFAWMKNKGMSRPKPSVSEKQVDVHEKEGVWSMLPQWDSDMITFDNAQNTLAHFEPTKCDRENVIRQVRILTKLNEITNGVECKAFISRQIFRILQVNLWFMEKHTDFRQAIINKLQEFAQDYKEEANEIAREFAWMMDYPYLRCKYCGESGKCPIRDGEETFCSQEHVELFSANGDCSHDPKLCKEELDKELDEYRATDPRVVNPQTKWNYLQHLQGKPGILRGWRPQDVRSPSKPDDEECIEEDTDDEMPALECAFCHKTEHCAEGCTNTWVKIPKP